MHFLFFLVPLSALLCGLSLAEEELPDIVLDHFRLNEEKTHAQFPLHCPECFAKTKTKEHQYLECDFQISSGEDEEAAFMFNGHYVPENLFDSQYKSGHMGNPRGIKEKSRDDASQHRISGILYYQTVSESKKLDIKGVQFNLSRVATIKGKFDVDYGVRISYARRPIPKILRISMGPVIEHPFSEPDQWIKPPAGEDFAQKAKGPIDPDFVYGTMNSYGMECKSMMCRVQNRFGKVSEKVGDFRGRLSDRFKKTRKECLEMKGAKKPLYCHPYEHKSSRFVFYVSAFLIVAVFGRIWFKLCRGCAARLSRPRKGPLADEVAGKEV